MYDVITVGAATRDLFLKSRDFSVAEAGQYLAGRAECLPLGAKIVVRHIEFVTGGGATNAAVSFTRKGLSAAAISKIGRDAGGRQIIEDMAHEGVVTRFVQETASVGTAYAIALIAVNGERSELVYRGASDHIDPASIPWPECLAKWFYMSSVGGNLELVRMVVENAHHQRAKVAWNPGSLELHQGLAKLKSILKHVEILILNQEEAAELTSLPFEDTTNIFMTLRALVSGMVLMTRGPEGALVAVGKHLYNCGIFPERTVADRTGAGDAFGSGFVAGIIIDGSVEEGLRIASANATAKIEHIGAKAGLLTLRQLNESRWRHFPVERRLL